MDIQLAQILAMTIYKVVSLVIGVLLCYMGYKLFMTGIWGDVGDAEGKFGNNKILIKKAAPGTFFVLMGAIIIGLTIAKGMNLENISIEKGVRNEKPSLAD